MMVRKCARAIPTTEGRTETRIVRHDAVTFADIHNAPCRPGVRAAVKPIVPLFRAAHEKPLEKFTIFKAALAQAF